MNDSKGFWPRFWTHMKGAIVPALIVGLIFTPLVVLLIFLILRDPVMLTGDQVKMVSLQNQIYSKFVEIFVVIATVLAAFGTLLGIGLYNALRAKLNQVLDDTIERKSKVAHARTLALSFNEHAYQWHRRYENLLQDCLANGDEPCSEKSTECLELINISFCLVEHGLEPFEELPYELQQDFLEDARGQKALVNLLNQYVYCETGRMLVSQERPTKLLLADLRDKADQLFDLGLGKTLANDEYNWWEST